MDPQYQQSPPIEQATKKRSNLIFYALALLVIGIVAYGVYWWQQQEVSRLNDKVSSLESQVASAKASTPTATAPISEESYLEIPEMGVKLKLSQNIKDAYYQVESDSTVSLKTHSLDVEKNCKENALSIVGLTKVNKDAENQLSGKKYSDEGTGVVIGNDYYYMQGAQYGCAEKATNVELLSKVRQAFIAASKTVEKL